LRDQILLSEKLITTKTLLIPPTQTLW